jgi:hypothetical protein
MSGCMNLFAQLLRVFFVVSALFGAMGCRPIDAAFDCNTICTRYKDCFDGSYDVESCADRCRASAQADDEFYRSVDTCEACMTDRACAGATFSCGGDCGQVVP